MVPAPGVALQRVGEILFQFVVQPAPAEQGPALFLGVLPVQLPQQENAELRPEADALHAVVPEHGGVALEPVQQLPGPGVAADHAGHLQVEAFKGRQFQQEAPDGQVKAAVDGGLEIDEHLPEGLIHQVRSEGPPGGHQPGGDDQAQGVADGFLQNAGDLGVGHRGAVRLEQLPDVLPVEEESVGVQHRHEPRVLKGHETARRRAPGEQQEAPLGRLPDEGAQGLPLPLILEPLEVVQQQEVPIAVGRGKGEVRLGGAAPQGRAAGQQGVGQGSLAKAAGGAEKEDTAPVQKTVEFLCHSGLDDDIG